MPSGAIPYPFGDCRVCGDHATGVHYGVATCEGCKGFYKRSLAKAYKYRCFHGGKCSISPMERNRCKSCRYQRCVMVGMSVDGVKMGRIPKVDKERALEEHYGCGSREILSSGIVIPQPNKRHAKDPSKLSSMDNGDTVDLSGIEDSNLPGAVGGGGHHFSKQAYQQALISGSFERHHDTIDRRRSDDYSEIFSDRHCLETRVKLETVDPITSAELQRQIGLNMDISYQPDGFRASLKNSDSAFVHGRSGRPSSEGVMGHGQTDSQYSYTATDGLSNMAASRHASAHLRHEDGTFPRFSDHSTDLRFNNSGGDLESGRCMDQSYRNDSLRNEAVKSRNTCGNGSIRSDLCSRKRSSVNDDEDDVRMIWNSGYRAGGGAPVDRRYTMISQPTSRTKYAPTLPPHRDRADTFSGHPVISGRRSAGDEACREGRGLGVEASGRPRSNDNGLSPFYPPVIKELIAQVIDSGKDTRELKHTLVKQLMSTTNSHPLTSASPSSSTQHTASSTLPHPYSASSLSPASSVSVQSAGSGGPAGGSSGMHWSGTSSSGGRSPLPQSNLGSDCGDDSKPAEPGIEEYEEGEDGFRDMEWTTSNSESCQWRSQPRKRVLNDDELSEEADEDSNGENIPLKRSHSASELYSNCDTLPSAQSERQRAKDSSVERDISEYISDSLSLSGNSDRVSFPELVKRQKQQMKMWPKDEGMLEGKKYELEHMMVEAGQRGKLRDAIDRICEEMAFGDVPILNLDSNSITANGEPLHKSETETLPSQSGIASEQIGSVHMFDDTLGRDKSDETLLNNDTMKIKEEILCNDEEYGKCGRSKPFLNGNIDEGVVVADPSVKQSDKSLHIDGARNQARLCMNQGYITPADSSRCHQPDSSMAVVRYDPDKAAAISGEEADSERRGLLMRRVLRCIKIFADKVMHLVEIEIGIAVDEALGRRPIHKLNDPATVITQEEVCVFWNDFMLTLPRANSVIMGLCANIPGFKQLNVSDQLTLIEQAYYMLWMILYNRLFWDGDCHIRINCEAMYSRSWFNRFFPESLVESMFSFAEELSRCQLTPTELMILCALQLTNVDGAKLENPWRVQRLHDYYLDLLAYEIEKSHVTNHSRILIKIFQLLPLLAPMNQQQLEVVDTFSVDQPPISTS